MFVVLVAFWDVKWVYNDHYLMCFICIRLKAVLSA